MSKDYRVHQESRRKFVKTVAYVTPAIVTLTAIPSFASAGSGNGERPNGNRVERSRGHRVDRARRIRRNIRQRLQHLGANERDMQYKKVLHARLNRLNEKYHLDA